MKKSFLFASLFVTSFFAYFSSSFAFDAKETQTYFNGPTVTSVSSTSATFSLSPEVLAKLSEEEKASLYFEYSEPEKACIMIYPTPAECLPKKTTLGSTTVTIATLAPNTKYSVVYKKENTIRCITTPCPENGFESLSVTFITKKNIDKGNGQGSSTRRSIKKTFGMRSRGDEVKYVQDMLIQRGFMEGEATGYFGAITTQAVKKFQRSMGIPETGYIGQLTRKAINDILSGE